MHANEVASNPESSSNSGRDTSGAVFRKNCRTKEIPGRLSESVCQHACINSQMLSLSPSLNASSGLSGRKPFITLRMTAASLWILLKGTSSVKV